MTDEFVEEDRMNAKERKEVRSAAAKKGARTRKANLAAQQQNRPSGVSWGWLGWVVAAILVVVIAIYLANKQDASASAAPAAQPTTVPAAPIATAMPVATPQAPSSDQPAAPVAAPSSLDAMPKVVIDQAPLNTWFHRVFNTSLFNEANHWGGADSWFVTLLLGPNSGGSWMSHGNPDEIVYRGTSTHLQWQLGVMTTAQYKEQFMARSTAQNAAINIRIAPNSVVTVVTASGKTVQQATSDMGDITVILPDSGTVSISVDYTTAAPTHESLVWWGPYDRSANINTVDAR